MPVTDIALRQVELYSLIFFRIAGIIFMMPFFGSDNVPRLVRIGLGLTITIMLVPALNLSGIPLPGDIWTYTVVVFKEMFVGLAIGFVANIIFNGIQFSGDLVGFQMGLRIGNVIDPMSEEQISVIGTIQNLLAVLIYISLFWDHFLFQAMAASFRVIPIAGVHLEGPMALEFVRMTGEIFIIALKLGAPLLAALFLADVALGFIARTAPQINVFIIGFPVKVGMGILLLGISLPFFVYVFTKLVHGMENNIMILLRYL